MRKGHSIDTVLKVIDKYPKNKLYIGVYNGEEIFNGLEQKALSIGCEVQPEPFDIAWSYYNKLPPDDKKNVYLLLHDGTKLDFLQGKIDEINIIFPWKAMTAHYIEHRDISDFLITYSSSKYFGSLLRPKGILSVVVDTKNLREKDSGALIEQNLHSESLRHISTQGIDFPDTTYGYRFMESQHHNPKEIIFRKIIQYN